MLIILFLWLRVVASGIHDYGMNHFSKIEIIIFLLFARR